MTQAIFGLIGVIVGALVTGSVTYRMERRRERRSIRAAARVVQQEFVDAMISAGQVHLYEKDEVVTRKIEVREREWQEHNARLAEELDGAAWSELNWAAEHRREFMNWLSEQKTLRADDYTLLRISNLTWWANKGWDALARAAGIPWRTRRQLRREHQRGADGRL